ncbi:hypothetical protein B7494_g1998 [Chlorociboria aeruginascens]|nr:hypothetical protein B7494_g1998 [Chlorociboria aeruginascens]
MNDQPPPKRVTRARAAAKIDTAVKTTKIATAAAKAKVTRTTSTTKRKTRADETPEEEEHSGTMDDLGKSDPPKTTRGRPKKTAIVEPEPEGNEKPAPAKNTRGRQKKPAVDPPALPVSDPATSTRARAKKAEPKEETMVLEEPGPRTTRTRTATISKATAPKKTVKFEGPDKENVIPVAANTKGKAKVTESGLRAKPIRKAAPTTRATRGRAKATEETEKSSPLSPKKATQVSMARDTNSDDELAIAEKTPMKPLMKSPVKPPGGIRAGKKLDFSTHTAAQSFTATQDLGATIVASPARRPPPSPLKESLKTSPQKGPLGNSLLQTPFKVSLPSKQPIATEPSFKSSLLQSPARRPQSPTKVTEAGSPARVAHTGSVIIATPRISKFSVSKSGTPRTLTKSAIRPPGQLFPSSSKEFSTGSPQATNNGNTPLSPEPGLTFTGRLSSIMPRESDPAFAGGHETIDEEVVIQDIVDESLVVDEPKSIGEVIAESTTPPCSPPRYSTGTYGLRPEDENPFLDSEDEDELASQDSKYSPAPLTGFHISARDFAPSPATPIRLTTISKTPKTDGTQRSAVIRPGRQKEIGFTPLAKQLNDWMAASPERSGSGSADREISSPTANRFPASGESEAVLSPAKSTFFEDEMSVRDEMAPIELEEVEEINFSPVELDDEDFALAHEADELSLLEPEEVFHMQEAEINGEHENAPSEASQEYGDENEILLDPALFEIPASPTYPTVSTPALVTPKRVLSERVFHTVSKVPLKPEGIESPMRPSPKKRSASGSKLPVQRPSSLSRSNTVISYSPTKSRRQWNSPDAVMQDACATPSKPEPASWSTCGTPARTPRRDLNTALLQGAVVFVDVYTSEGADASILFTELLTQMGARCVKSWSWNGNESGEDSKIGITHVVFKDGGKRTLEKAKETGGVVSCVGVGWVLDCERENKWLDEAAYAVDTGLVPRGGHRRRKSMEPRALANLNGTLLPSTTPSRNGSSSFGETPTTFKTHRRESVQWYRSPASSSSSEDKIDDETMILTPVPATPAPETISAYNEAYLDDLNGAETPGTYFLDQRLAQQTAPQQRFGNVTEGKGFLSEKKDETVMMRLMAARRKSLQWAPKVGSPLAKGGQWDL